MKLSPLITAVSDRRLRVARNVVTPQMAIRLGVAAALVITVFSILGIRLYALTVLSGAQYERLARQNQVRQIAIEAPRGSITDRHGRKLVTNRPAREVVLNLQDVKPEDRELLFKRLSRTLEIPRTEIEEMVGDAATAPLEPVVISEDVKKDEMIFYISEHAEYFPGVDIRDRYVRSYPAGRDAAHILGQVGEVDPEQLKGEYAERKPGDHVGQSGLERQYDKYLRGVDGYRAIEVDASGIRQEEGRGVPSIPGRDLKLTIDLRMQHATEQALREGIAIAHASGDGAGADAGAAVAIDPRNGDVLAVASFPGFNPAAFVPPSKPSAINAILKDPATPLTNRAISGLYPPGSIYKPITGIAAMNEGFINADTMLSCPPSLEISGMNFNNWMDEHLGSMNLAHALEVSCDTYFYALALHFYNMPGSRLQDWSREFGLGEPSGLDFPGEQGGVVPTPEWRQAMFSGWEKTWSPGHSVNLSIGQGDLLVTPLQMTRVYAALANGGELHTPQLAMSVEDPTGDSAVRFNRPPSKKIPVNDRQIAAVHEGLYLAANSSVGTSSAVFAGFEVPVAGKTGTVEKPPHGDMAWYCGYAPAYAPTIAACAVIEKGGHGGTSAAPVVLRMFQQWFKAEGGNAEARQVSD